MHPPITKPIPTLSLIPLAHSSLRSKQAPTSHVWEPCQAKGSQLAPPLSRLPINLWLSHLPRLCEQTATQRFHPGPGGAHLSGWWQGLRRGRPKPIQLPPFPPGPHFSMKTMGTWRREWDCEEEGGVTEKEKRGSGLEE